MIGLRRDGLRRILSGLLAGPLAAAGLIVVTASAASAEPVRAFAPVFASITNGDIMLTGNTLLTCPAGSLSSAAPVISCATAQGSGSFGANNYFSMVNVDVDSDAATFNSSTAMVSVPAGATVLYAALSWGANTSAGTRGAAAPSAASKGMVKFKAPNGSYATVTSISTDISGTNYQGFADVTSTVAAAGSGSYAVGSVQAGVGVDRYAGWSLAIAYRDATQPIRNLLIYHGYGWLSTTDQQMALPISGFTTPSTGRVVTRLGVVAYEGDRWLKGDGLSLNDTAISNGLNPANDVFNSTASNLGAAVSNRNPAYANLLGVDIDRFDATGVLANGATSATVTFGTAVTGGGESYSPSLLTVAIDLSASSVVLTSVPSVPVGGVVAFTATVAPTIPTGAVTFLVVPATGPQRGRTVVLGNVKLVNGVAKLQTVLAAYGNNPVTAVYGGDANNALATSPARVVTVNAAVGDLIVNQFRLSGPGGAADQYLELVNAGSVTIPLGGFRVQSSSGTTVTLPISSGTLPVGRSLLLTGAAFSLGSVSHSDLAAGDLGSGGLRLVAPDAAATVTDAVGPNVAGYFSGTPLSAPAGNPSDQYGWVRVQLPDHPKNTRNNAADFALVSVTAGLVGGVQSMLGSPSPSGTKDPYRRDTLTSTLLDPARTVAEAPNREVVAGVPGRPPTLTVRRVITNMGTSAMSLVKLRLTSLSELNGLSQAGVPGQGGAGAELRLIDPLSPSSVVTVGTGSVTVLNLGIDGPAVAGVGGGLDSTLSVPLTAGALAPGASVDVALTFSVDADGIEWFDYQVDGS